MTVLAVFKNFIDIAKIFISIAVVATFGSIFNGYALSVLWGWFIVPTFGLPKLLVAPAIGITVAVILLTYHKDAKKYDSKSFGEAILKDIMLSISKPLFALLFGYIVHLFM